MTPVRRRRVAVWKTFKSDKGAVVGLVVLVGIILFSTVGPTIYHANPFSSVAPPFEKPLSSHGPLLGTDAAGRSVFTGVVYGGASTLLVGLIAGIFSLTVAMILGTVGGYFGGWVDAICMRITETTMVIPVVLFALVVLTLVRPSNISVAITIGMLTWPATARVARAEVAKFRESEFVKVARTQGCSAGKIIVGEILPNIMPPMIVLTTLVIATAMLFQAGLSYLGATNPNEMTWGLMVGQNSSSILEAWWPVTFPGIAIALTVLSVNLVGSGLNRLFNPKEAALELAVSGLGDTADL